MQPVTIAELLKATRGKLVKGSPERKVRGISIDSRTIKPGEIFVTLKGERFDGHDFIREAVKNGACGAIVSRRNKFALGCKNLIKVKDCLRALQLIARYHRREFEPVVIGITGSNGKTTTKEMAKALFSTQFTTLATRGNLNTQVGLPLNILNLNSQHQVALLEMAASQRGQIRRLCEIAQPAIGVITNIGQTHLQFFKSRKNVLFTKLELLSSLPRRGVIFVNTDDPLLSKIRRKDIIKVTYGFGPEASVRASEVVTTHSGVEFTLWIRGRNIRVGLKFFGEYNIYNALAAISVADWFGIGFDLIENVLRNFEPPSLRMELINLKHNVKLLNDSYNANPQSMRAAINTLSEFPGENRKLLIIGDMLEQGSYSHSLHRALGKFIASHRIDLLFTLGKEAEIAAWSAGKVGMAKKNIFAFQRKTRLLDKLLEILKPNDMILIKGSRALRMETLADQLKRGI